MTTDDDTGPDTDEIGTAQLRLADAGATLIAGTMVNAAGLCLAKIVPLDRLRTFATSGLGASPTWNIFTIDGGIAFTPSSGVVGDMRLRLDLERLTVLDGGLAWAPTEVFDQHGVPLPVDPRGRLRRTEQEIEAQGLTVMVGQELEFVLTAADGTRFDRPGWTPYGLSPLLDHEAFVTDLMAETAAAGIPLEQFHAEYASAQFEFSLAPTTPLAAADGVVLARLIVGRVARRHGLRASFSPFPFAGGGGSGAHVHFSFVRAGESVFSGGDGPHGIRAEGGSAIAGVLAALPGIQAVLAGSILSGERLRPGFWSGAYGCWGRENREAAVRYVEATPGNPHGANVEVKIVDPSANPYLACAAILGAALAGIRSSAALPDEVTGNPADLTAAEAVRSGAVLLPTDLGTALMALERSEIAATVLTPEIVEVQVAVRQFELDHHGDADPAELPERFRFAWSI